MTWGRTLKGLAASSGAGAGLRARRLAGRLRGKTVTALGPEHAAAGDPVYDRVTRRDWINPYSRPVTGRPCNPLILVNEDGKLYVSLWNNPNGEDCRDT